MGKRNRERREAKKRQKDSRRTRSRVGGTSDWESAGVEGSPSRGRPDLRSILLTYGRAFGVGEATELLSGLESALLHEASIVGRAAAALVYGTVVDECLSEVWEGGWQPGEVSRVVRRKLTVRHADLLTAAFAAFEWPKAQMPLRWATQLNELGAADGVPRSGRTWLTSWANAAGLDWSEALITGAQVLGVVAVLHRLEPLVPRPSQWSERVGVAGPNGLVDESVLAKVRALLAKAESTTFEEEANALTAKAQELISRHAIDDALAQGTGHQPREAPGARRIWVDDPYASAKGQLLAVVGASNRARVIWDATYGYMSVVGFESDLEAVEILFTSLLVQASHAMLARGKVLDERGRSRTRSFRQSFYLAFASRIHERLSVASREAATQASADLGREVLPVLAGRQDDVDAAMKRMFPSVRTMAGPAASNAEGWKAGRVAAEMAALGPKHEELATS